MFRGLIGWLGRVRLQVLSVLFSGMANCGAGSIPDQKRGSQRLSGACSECAKWSVDVDWGAVPSKCQGVRPPCRQNSVSVGAHRDNVDSRCGNAPGECREVVGCLAVLSGGVAAVRRE